jgi:hypothetical protein
MLTAQVTLATATPKPSGRPGNRRQPVKENSMLNRKRRLAVTGITIMSAALLTGLAATEASAATTAAARPSHATVAAATVAQATQAAPKASKVPDTSPVLCNTALIVWPCIQVFGTGLTVTSINYWAHNNSEVDFKPPIGQLRLELYLTNTDSVEPPTASNISVMAYTPEFNLNLGANSAAYAYTLAFVASQDEYVCVAVWWKYADGTQHDVGYGCAAVYA